MDWIERWLGVAPDNGDGTLELLLMLTVASIGLVVLLAAWPRSRAALMRLFGRPGLITGSAKASETRNRP